MSGRLIADDDALLTYQDTGRPDGPVLVLLHSLGADRRMWDSCLPALTREHRVVLPDTRGHGESGPARTASADQWVDDLHDVLVEAGAEDVLLVGVSMGGIQALAFAAAHPDTVRGVVVADSFAELTPAVAAARIESFREQCRRLPMTAVAEQYVADTFETPYPDGARGVRDAIAGMTADSYLSAVEVCFRVQIRDRLAKVAAPTLVLWGDRDAKSPRHLSEAIANGVEGARLEVLPDAGHLSNIDNPNAFTEAVLAFSAQCGARPAHPRAEGGS